MQKVHTNRKGAPIGNTTFAQLLERRIPLPIPDPQDIEGIVSIVAALLNPVGDDLSSTGEREAVYLRNNTHSDVSLNNWKITNRNSRDEQDLRGSLRPGAIGKFLVPDCPLSNNGGTITLLNTQDLKVDGVSYSREQARREGALIWFR